MAPDWRSVRRIESSAFDEQAAYLGAIRFRRVTFCVSRIAVSAVKLRFSGWRRWRETNVDSARLAIFRNKSHVQDLNSSCTQGTFLYLHPTVAPTVEVGSGRM